MIVYGGRKICSPTTHIPKYVLGSQTINVSRDTLQGMWAQITGTSEDFSEEEQFRSFV